MASEPVIAAAIKLRDRLGDVAKEIGYRRDGNAELNAMDAKVCADAAAMLEKLGTEVTRLRLGIGHLYYGRLDRTELWNMSRNWNSDAR